MTTPTSEDAFSITPHDVLVCKDALDRVCTAIRTSLDEIGAENNKLLAGWEGEAREEFMARQAKWTSDADALQARLKQLVAGIENAVYSYVGADQYGADLIARRGS
jgi:WXG100 family type VII secretion target